VARETAWNTTAASIAMKGGEPQTLIMSSWTDLDFWLGPPMRREIMLRKIRTAPLWIFIALAFTVVAFAAFLLTLYFSVGGTAGDAPDVEVLYPWDCSFAAAGIGSVGSCTSLADNLGATIGISGFDNESILIVESSEGGSNNIRNNESVMMCPTLSEIPPDAHYQVTMSGTAPAGVAPGGTEILRLMYRFVGLLPGETVAIDASVSFAPCP